MENIIITLIIIAISIYSSVKNNKKKQKQEAAPSPTPAASPVNEIEDLIRKIQEQNKQKSVVNEDDSEEPFDDEDEIEDGYEQDVEETYLEEVDEDKKGKYEYIELERSEQNTSKSNIRPLFDEGGTILKQEASESLISDNDDENQMNIDMRQAVIYSAILNRPQY